MKYCTYCGKALDDDARFCSNCGKAVGNTTVSSLFNNEPADIDVGYRVVLISRGTCSATTAREVICDLLGYTAATARNLIDEAPVEVADELNRLQAKIIAQCLAEYGMEVTVVDENNTYVNLNGETELSSVFDASGELIAMAAATLATLTAANMVHRYRRYKKPSLLSLLFRPRYVRKPPKHIRRKISRDPEPRNRFAIGKGYDFLQTLHTGKPVKAQPRDDHRGRKPDGRRR